MCCCISDQPVEDNRQKRRTFNGPNLFQTTMMDAPCKDGLNTLCWFCCQFSPFTCGCTQYFLRRKVLRGDMTKYRCCQGYYNCCGMKAGMCFESTCPDLCLCLEAHLCNGQAVSASRMYIMDRYDLQSDPCDYRLIRINNCIQIAACVCDILAILDESLRDLANILDRIADCVYHTVSGCMTAQVAFEQNFQDANKNPGRDMEAELDYSYGNPSHPVHVPQGSGFGHGQQQRVHPYPQAQPTPAVVYVQQPAPQQVVYVQQQRMPQQQQVVYMQQQPPAGSAVYVQQATQQQVMFVR